MRLLGLLLACAALASVTGCDGGANARNGLPVQCLDEPDPGPCKGRTPRFYYDYPSDTCRMFYHGGCRGRVPFETRSACEETCVAGRR
jgi:hypothetical protein